MLFAGLLERTRFQSQAEPDQADLLDRICTGPLIDAEVLRAEGVFDDDSAATTRAGDDRQTSLRSEDHAR